MTFIRALNIHKIIGRTISFTQILLLVTYDIVSLAVFNRIFGEESEPLADKIENNKEKSNKISQDNIYPTLELSKIENYPENTVS